MRLEFEEKKHSSITLSRCKEVPLWIKNKLSYCSKIKLKSNLSRINEISCRYMEKSGTSYFHSSLIREHLPFNVHLFSLNDGKRNC